jgi:aspartate beta-hydroxylase
MTEKMNFVTVFYIFYRFYFHLGDGLTRLGRTHEAYAVYGDAVGHGLFPSVFQRSMHNLKGLTARPWWPMDQLECAKQLRQLERHWTAIKGQPEK